MSSKSTYKIMVDARPIADRHCVSETIRASDGILDASERRCVPLERIGANREEIRRLARKYMVPVPVIDQSKHNSVTVYRGRRNIRISQTAAATMWGTTIPKHIRVTAYNGTTLIMSPASVKTANSKRYNTAGIVFSIWPQLAGMLDAAGMTDPQFALKATTKERCERI